MYGKILLLAVTTSLAVNISSPAQADVILAENFNSLTLGFTQPAPGAPGHGGWYSAEIVSPSFGEIQNTLANTGNALRVFSSSANVDAQQANVAHTVGPINVSASTNITLRADVYASSSDLAAQNSYLGRVSARSADGFFEILGFELFSGNGDVKSTDRVDLTLNVFNSAIDNNTGFFPAVGEDLAWDTWHSIVLVADQVADEYISLTVNGMTQSLTGLPLPRFGAPRIRGQEIELLDVQLIADDSFGALTDDQLFVDNLQLDANNLPGGAGAQVVPEPSSLLLFILIGAVGAAFFHRHQRVGARPLVNAGRGAALLGLLLGAPNFARADTIRHFTDGTAPGQFPGVSNLLDSVGIGQSNVASETTASSFVVPGAGPVNLSFAVEVDFGSFQYEFGFFDVSQTTANPVTQPKSFAIEALTNATSVFDDRLVNPGATRTLTVNGGQELGFFIVPNNTIAGFLANPDVFFDPYTFGLVGSRQAPLFALANANPGQFDQFLSFIGNGVTLFTFEDLSRAGTTDNSFTDLGFTIDAELLPSNQIPAAAAAVPEPSSWAIMLVVIAVGAASFVRKKP